jgi:glycosyltransferase involved in cell wall biosynthesis
MAIDMADRKAFLTAALAKADRVIAPSAYLMEIFSHNDNHLPVQVIPYGHDLSWLSSFAGKKPSRQLRIGYMGQIVSIKGVHLLIQAFTRMAAPEEPTLFIYGDLTKDPCYVQQLRELASTHANINFEGPFSRERLGEVLSRLDVVVVPSLWFENNPLVIQEAFATKTPVIATNLGGIREFTQHGVNGLLFERGNVEDLAAQLRRVVLERGLLQQLQAGIPQVRGIDEEVCELEQIYQSLFQQRMASAG